MSGIGKLIKVHGFVNTVLLPILHFDVLKDHKDYVPGNLFLVNHHRYWIRARQPDVPRIGERVRLVLYRDYTTRVQRLLQRHAVKKTLAELQATSYGRAKAEQMRLGYNEPTFEHPEADHVF